METRFNRNDTRYFNFRLSKWFRSPKRNNSPRFFDTPRYDESLESDRNSDVGYTARGLQRQSHLNIFKSYLNNAQSNSPIKPELSQFEESPVIKVENCDDSAPGIADNISHTQHFACKMPNKPVSLAPDDIVRHKIPEDINDGVQFRKQFTNNKLLKKLSHHIIKKEIKPNCTEIVYSNRDMTNPQPFTGSQIIDYSMSPRKYVKKSDLVNDINSHHLKSDSKS